MTVRARAKSADGASVFGLLTLEAARGTELELEADGPDAEAVLADLERIFSAEE